MRKRLQRLSDNQLVEEFLKDHNKEVFGEIYHRTFDSVCRFVFSRVGNEAAMQDIVSETYFALLTAIGSFNFSSRLSSFIIGIALNKMRSYYHKESKMPQVELDDQAVYLEPEDDLDKHYEKTVRKVQTVLDKLPEKYKTILHHRYILTHSVRDTAQAMGLTEANVRVLQHRALKKAKTIGEALP